MEKLADYETQLVKDTAERLTKGEVTVQGKIKSLFHYVRDEIKFGFMEAWDEVKASEVIQRGIGQCSNKATLLLALCKAVDIPAKVHHGYIKTEILKGIFPGYAFAFFPKKGSHSWIEVEVNGRWRKIDSYINDKAFFTAAKAEIERRGWDIGFSLACPDGKCDCEFNLDEETFVQMGAVVEEHGVWDDPSEFMATDEYLKMSPIHMFFLKLMVGGANNKIEQMRKRHSEDYI